MQKFTALTMLLFSLSTITAIAQQPSATASNAPSPVSSSTPQQSRMTLPKGWLRVPGDSVATMVFRSPAGPQDIRIAKIGPDPSFTGESGVQKVKQVVARFPFPQKDVTQTTVCDGAQPAILTVAKSEKSETVMEQIVVVGKTGGAIITYEIGDGKPDSEAEKAIRSVCVP